MMDAMKNVLRTDGFSALGARWSRGKMEQEIRKKRKERSSPLIFSRI